MNRSAPPVLVLAVLAVAVLAAACTSAGQPGAGDPGDGSAGGEDRAAEEPAADAGGEPTETTIENYPDAQTRALAARARERRPVADSALPPRHLVPDLHPESLVDRNRIVSGGPPPDGIPSIDTPSFSPVDSVDWLADEEPVAVLALDGETRIYPAQILIWHEIVNDNIDGQPITMTYCPLCNSVVAFDATVSGPDGEDLALEFGTSGALYQSALVMYDRQTESLWTHFDGRSVIGTMAGTELQILPASMVSWVDASQANPAALVLDRPTGELARPYGTVPYPNYETAPPTDAYLTDAVDERFAPKQRVVGVNLGDRRVAINRDALQSERVITVEPQVDGDGFVVLWEPGTVSALDGRQIDEGLAVGAVGVFRPVIDGRPLTFSIDQTNTDDGEVSVVDNETGSTWNVSGQAIAGPLTGTTLDPVAHLDTFWFAWSRYYPETAVVE